MLPENVPIEPDRVLTDPQNWASQSHQQLYDSVHHNNDPGQSGEIGAQWAKCASELVECARQITAQVAASESQWTGDAADGARAAMRKLADWVEETARTAVEVGDKVTEQGRVMATARAQMPEPFEFDWAGTAAFLSQPGIPSFVRAAADVSIANSIARAMHDQAVTVMTDMENDSRRIDSSTPAFRAPFNPVTGQIEDPAIALRAFSGAPTSYTAEVPVAEHPQGGNSHVISPLSPSGGERAELPPSNPAGRDPGGYPPSSAAQTGGHTLTPPVPEQDVTAAATYAPSQQHQQSYSPQVPASGVTHTGGADHRPHLPTGAGPAGFTPQMPKAGVQTPPPHVPRGGGLPFRQNPDVVPKPNPAAGGGSPPPASTPPATRGFGGGSRPGNANGAGGISGPGNTSGAGGMSGAGGPGGGGGAGPHSATKGFSGGGPGGVASFGATGAGTQPGTSAGVTPVQGRSGSPSGMTPPGGASAAAPGTGGPPPGGPAGGRGEEDKEHRSAGYIIGGDLFEVPGSDLPPAVIGDTKTKKQRKADGS